MAASYKVFKKKRLVIVTTSGETNIDETIRTFERMFADPKYAMDYDLLWDDTERTTAVTYDDLLKLSQHFKHYAGDKHPKRAIVISQTDKHAMTKVFSTMASVSTKAEFGLFQEMGEALKWLKRRA